MVVIVDYNVGNVRSVLNCAKRINLDAVVSRDVELIRNADGIILPGVGSFPVAMDNLEKYGLIKVLNEAKKSGIPILGICLGMQILFQKGFEVETRDGLGFLNGNVSLIKTDEKLPHIGWNELYFNQKNPIIQNVDELADVYFVHSYMADFNDEETIAYCVYGDTKIPAISGKDNVIGCQFHPEKSGSVGEKIMKAWKENFIC